MTADEMMELYRILGEPMEGRSSGGGSGKAKSQVPVSLDALELRADLEAWFAPSPPSEAAVSLWLSGDEFATWARVWVGRCKALIFDVRPVRELLGARCLECRADRVASETGGFQPAVIHLAELRRVECRACGWSGDLPSLTT